MPNQNKTLGEHAWLMEAALSRIKEAVDLELGNPARTNYEFAREISNILRNTLNEKV